MKYFDKFKKGGRTISQTPAPVKDRIYGSEYNKPQSAESGRSGDKIIVSESTLELINSILDKHNKKFPLKKVPISTAKAVVRRGMGAYSSSHRPTISGGKPNSRVAWGLARLKAFIYKVQNGKSKSGRYSQDNDLIEELGYEHHKYQKGGNMNQLLAPNGKPSNLNPEQYSLVRTPEFKAWFGDWENDPANASKVVDENGEPLVVYHGTKDNFSIFDLEKVGTKTDSGMWGRGFYFSSSKEYAKTYSDKPFDYQTGKVLSDKGVILDVFLSLKNPYIIKNTNDIPKIIIPNETIDDLINSDKLYSIKFRKKLIDDGYDGVFVKFEFDFRGSRDYELTAFEPNQIKLADGTNTTFDGNNPDIRFEIGGEVGVKNDDEAVVKYSKLFVKNGVDYFPSCIGHKNWSYTYRYKDTFSQINQYNFYENTCALFEVCEQPNRKPDYVSSSGSKYWYENNGVVRQSNHWGRIIASCSWFLSTDITNSKVISSNNFATGFCKFKDFLYLHLKDRWNIEKMDKYIISMFNEIKPKFAKGGKIPKKNLGGDCYFSAGQIVVYNKFLKEISFLGEPYLVHAEVQGQGEISKIRFGHAWVEDDYLVYDFSNNRRIILPKDLYYRLGDVKKKKGKYKKYTFTEARKKMVETGNYGCWDLDVQY